MPHSNSPESAIHSLIADRFWKRVEKGPDCWLWQGPINQWGYGRVSLPHSGFYAHRLSWMLTHGDIPEGMLVCHSCDTPACVRPDHLWLGTPRENMHDMLRKGRLARGKLSMDVAREIRGVYAAGGISTTAIAALYGVGQSTVMDVVLNKTWKEGVR